MKCKIFGNFWRGNLERADGKGFNAEGMTPFTGVIVIEGNGRFVGSTWDKYGQAEILGNISTSRLEFEKVYIKPNGPHGTGIHYLLQGSAPNGAHGGWWGIYTQDGEKSFRAPGQATCTVHPDPNG